jgi:hypothetical protein
MSNTLNRLRKRYALNQYVTVVGAQHPVAVEWAKRVVTNGGAGPSSNTIKVLSTFMFGMDTAGLTNKVLLINTFAPDNLIASLTPLLKFTGNDPWTNNNFVAGDLTVDGLKGNGSSKYLNTGVLPNQFMTDGSASSIYYFNTTGSTNYTFIGSTSGPGRLRNSWDTTIGYGNYGESFSDSNQVKANNNTAWFRGYICSSKTTTSLLNLYFANSTTAHYAVGTNTGTDGAGTNSPSNVVTYVFASNEAGTAASYCSGRLSFAALGKGLSSTDSLNLYTLVQAMRTSLGGGYV